MCGKNGLAVVSGQVMAGSPPRVREKQNFGTAETYPDRITPACAGKTKTDDLKQIG